VLKIEDLIFKYGDMEILKSINIDIEKKDFSGIIGPNGSGKSTLLKNISKILQPESGVIYYDRKLLNEYNAQELAKSMAVVPQETRINFDFSIYDLIMMGRNPYQDRWGRIKEEDKKIVKRSMELTDTFKFKDKNINELSGGEQQRVIIARAIAQQPEVLLLDEPTASLDINYQREIYSLLSYLNNKLDITIVAVSHDLNLTGQYCDKIILLNNGDIFVTGTPEEVLTAKNISEVYNTEVIVKENTLTGKPYVTIVPKTFRPPENRASKNTKIHVICGGGTGKDLLEVLYTKGYVLSCGVLNQGDSDWETARRLNIELVEIPPFVPVDKEHKNKNINLMQKAELVVVCDTPFGNGNVSNLAQVAELTDTNIILFNERDITERDYTGGEAQKYWQEIIKCKDCYLVNNRQELFAIIKDIK